MQNLTILVDMDDTLECLSTAWIDYLNEHFYTNVSPSDIDSWDMSKAFPTLTPEEIYGVLSHEELWKTVTPIPGAVKYLKKLIDDGHDVYVVTASQPETVNTKLQLVLFRYFPYITREKVIITGNKQMIRGDILIDDGFHNFGGQPMGMLFTANHNRDISDKALAMVNAVRVKNWKEIYELIHNYQKHFKTGGTQ